MAEHKKRGHETSALVHQHQAGAKFTKEDREEGEVWRIPIQGTAVYVPISLKFPKHFNQALDSKSPDVLHLHMPNVSCFWALFSSKAKRVPWVVHWHSDVVGEKPDWRIRCLYPIYRIFERAVLNRAERILVTSPPYLKNSAALAGYVDKCRIVPLGIEDQTPNIAKVDSSDAPLKLLCVGRLTYYKGHSFLLDAVKQLSEINEDVHLTVVGLGDLEKELKEYVSTHQLNSHVTFLGTVSNEELATQIANTDVLCLPSIEKTEAFGVVLLEAMRAGKPCLVTNVEGSGMSWVVENGQTGFVVQHSNSEAIAEVLIDTNRNRKQLLRMGTNGRTRYLREFTIEKVAAQIEEIYADVISKVY